MVHAVISPFQRRVVVGAAFLTAIALVVVLNRRGDRAGVAPAAPGFRFTDVAAQVGITFVHHGPTLDPKLDNIAPLIGSLFTSATETDAPNEPMSGAMLSSFGSRVGP